MNKLNDKKGSFIILYNKGDSPELWERAEEELHTYGYSTLPLPYNKKISSFCADLASENHPSPYYILAYGNSIQRLAKIKKSLPEKLAAIILISPAIKTNGLSKFGRRNILQRPSFLSGNSTPILIFSSTKHNAKYLDSIVNICNNYRMIYNIVIKGAKANILTDSSAYQNQFWAGLRAYLNVQAN